MLREFPLPVAETGQRQDEGGPFSYRLWIDTLCCPVSCSRDEKRRALERMTDVYREAAHVLVLNKSIAPFGWEVDGTAAGSAETCLRILGMATWMRRLWTLQGMGTRQLIERNGADTKGILQKALWQSQYPFGSETGWSVFPKKWRDFPNLLIKITGTITS